MKLLRIISIPVLLLLIVLFSVRIGKKEDLARSSSFDAVTFAQDLWDKQLPSCILNAPVDEEVIAMLHQNVPEAFRKYGRKVGISKTAYILMKGKGTLIRKHEEHLTVVNDARDTLLIATAFIFGNAVRDGSGLVDVSDFVNMTAFNDVSVALNKLVRAKLIPVLSADDVKIGKSIVYAGVTELREDKPVPSVIPLIPVQATIQNE